MDFIRRHSFIITLALVLWVFPLQTYAQFDIDLSTIRDTLNSGLQTAAYYLVVEGLGLLVWFGALILDFAINNFVIGFGDTFIKSGIGLAVNQTWVIIRDFVNMFFIFGFVYIGFKMILNSSDSNTRRWLVNILLAALLVNFSLFITKFAIDFTNQLASQIAVNGLGTTGEWDTETDLYKVNLTSEFMSRMGVSDILGIDYKVVEGGGWGYIIGTAILFLTAAFVFAAGGIILIIRFAMLNLFMMLSPIMFLSWVLPPVKDTMQRFWSAFFGRALYAPIYLLFIYFSLQIIAGLQISVTGENSSFANPNWAGTFQALNEVNGGTATGTLGTLPFFILICIFLALSISFADKLGADGGSMAVKLGRSFSNKIRKTAVNNSVGFGLRGVNRVSDAAQGGYNRLDARLSTTQGGRFIRGTATALSLGALSDKNVRGALDAGKKLSIDGSETAEQVDKLGTDRQILQNKTNKEIARARDFGINHGIGEDVDGVHTPEAREEAKNAMAAVIRDMSDDELKGLSLEQLKSNTVAGHLSDAQIKMLSDAGIYSNVDIKGLRESRNNATFSGIEATLNGTGKEFADAGEEAKALEEAFESLGKTIKGIGDERLAGLGTAKLLNERYATHLSDSQIESLQKSGKYSLADIENIKKARTKGIQNSAGIGDGADEFFKGRHAGAATNTANSRAEKLFQKNVQDAGKLPPAMFMSEQMSKHVTPQALEQRIRNGVTNSEAAEIKRVLSAHIKSLTPDDPSRKAWKSWDDRSVNAARINLDIY